MVLVDLPDACKASMILPTGLEMFSKRCDVGGVAGRVEDGSVEEEATGTYGAAR